MGDGERGGVGAGGRRQGEGLEERGMEGAAKATRRGQRERVRQLMGEVDQAQQTLQSLFLLRLATGPSEVGD